MGQIEEFDLSKIKKVKITEVRPNTWNPKEKNHAKVQDIKKSIETMGFKQPISVRQNKGYEILDGEQRYTAMLELGATEIYIYDNGVISDEDAQSETIWWQVQVPFDEIKLAPLVVSLFDMGKPLPYTQQEVEDFRQMAEFDFNQYETNRPDFEDGVKTLNIKMGKDAYNVVMQAIEKCKQTDPDNISEARAVELIAADYLGG